MRRFLLTSFCAAAVVQLSACVGMSTLAEPVSIKIVRSASVQPVQGMKADATLIHTPLGIALHDEAKAALQWDKIDWLAQDVLIVNFNSAGQRLGDLRIKGYVLYVPTMTAEGSADGNSCIVAVIEKNRATQVKVEQK